MIFKDLIKEEIWHILRPYCFIASAFFDSNARSHWLNQGHVDEFKSNVFPAGQHLENCRPAGENCSPAVTFDTGKIRGRRYKKFVFAILTVFIKKQKWSPQRNVLLILQKMKLENSL